MAIVLDKYEIVLNAHDDFIFTEREAHYEC